VTILHLTCQGTGAGASISIALLARAQRAAGRRVLVGCPPGCFLEARSREAGAETVPLDFARLGSAARDVARLVALEGVRVVNAHGSRDRAACRRARLLGRLPAALVMTRRSMPRSTVFSTLADAALADAVIAVSRPVAGALARRGIPGAKLTVVPNAVDLARLDRPVTSAEVTDARAMIVRFIVRRDAPRSSFLAPRPCLGIVSRRKDHATLLAALLRLDRPVTVVCLGVAPAADLVAAARRAAPHAVAFVPFVHDPRPFYELFDVCALPTRGEGLSQAVLEAMALGKPVVTTAAGGNTDAVRDGVDGLLVPPRDPARMAAALGRVLDDATLARRLGAAARARVRAEFPIGRTHALTDAVYRAALARRGEDGAGGVAA